MAAVGMLALAISVPLVVVANLFGNRGPLFYSQPRVGKGGVEFTIHKFRTMPPGSGTSSWTAKDDPRLGKVGRMLRQPPFRRATADVERASPRPVDRGPTT